MTRSKSCWWPVSKSSGMSAIATACRPAGSRTTRRSGGRRPDGRSLRGRRARCDRRRRCGRAPARSSVPSGSRTAGAEARRRRRASPRVPGATASRARRSASIDRRRRARRTARGSTTCRSRCRRSARRGAWSHGDGAAWPRRLDGVLEEHRDRQRTDAAGHRRQRAGHLGDAGMHVADDDRCRGARSRRGAASPASKRSRATARRRSTRLMPTSITVAPGLTNRGVTKPGRPIAATRMSAVAATAARSGVFEWQIVTVASRCSSSMRHRLADDLAAADDDRARARRSGCR